MSKEIRQHIDSFRDFRITENESSEFTCKEVDKSKWCWDFISRYLIFIIIFIIVLVYF